MLKVTHPARTSATARTLGLPLATWTRGGAPSRIWTTRLKATVTSKNRFANAATAGSSAGNPGAGTATSLTLEHSAG